MAATTTTNVVETLRYTYGADKVAYIGNEESVAWKILGRKKAPLGGRGQFILPQLIQNPGAWKGVPQGGTIPTPLQPDTAEASFSLQEFVGVYDLTWKLIQDARNNKFSFQRVFELMEQGIRRRFYRLLNADLIGTGRGELGIMPAADDGTTVTFNSLPSFEQGLVVDVMDLSDDNAKISDSATVSAVNVVAREGTLSVATSGSAAGDYATIEDTVTSTTSRHTHGLTGVIDDANPPTCKGNFGNVNRSTAGNEYWESIVLDNGAINRTLTEDLLLQLMDGAREKSGARFKAWISNRRIGRRYHDMLRTETFYALGRIAPISGGLGRPDEKPSDDGKSPYTFSGIPWHFDPYFRANTVIGLDTDHFFLGVGENDTPSLISDLFDVPTLTSTSLTTFDVRWYFQCELISDNPAGGGKIEDVAES